MPKCDLSNLLKSHFDIVVLMYLCCIVLEHHFQRTPLLRYASAFYCPIYPYYACKMHASFRTYQTSEGGQDVWGGVYYTGC